MTKLTNNNHFSIIIPTKDRADYLSQTLRTCVNQDYEQLEIIVSDDGSSDHTREVVEEASRKDGRIKYITPGNVGMLENFEYALNHISSGYLLALGGDDGLLPYAIRDINKIIVETGTEIVSWSTPNYCYQGTKMQTAQLVLNTKWGKPITDRRIINSKEFLKRQAKELQYVFDKESPMFYVQAAVATSLIDKVKARTEGRKFYSCACPDGYSGIVLAGEVEQYIHSDTPFTIDGTSPTSTGIAYLRDNEFSKKIANKMFEDSIERPMHKELGGLPYCPLISLMTVDFLLTARDLPGWPGSFPEINKLDMLKKAVNELTSNKYDEQNIAREMNILYDLSDFLGLSKEFRKIVKSARLKTWNSFEGSGLSPTNLYIDASEHHIENIFDAGYFTYYIHSFASKVSLTGIIKLFLRSAKHKFFSTRKVPISLPKSKEICDKR